jgi:hypothetical protein
MRAARLPQANCFFNLLLGNRFSWPVFRESSSPARSFSRSNEQGFNAFGLLPGQSRRPGIEDGKEKILLIQFEDAGDFSVG